MMESGTADAITSAAAGASFDAASLEAEPPAPQAEDRTTEQLTQMVAIDRERVCTRQRVKGGAEIVTNVSTRKLQHVHARGGHENLRPVLRI